MIAKIIITIESNLTHIAGCEVNFHVTESDLEKNGDGLKAKLLAEIASMSSWVVPEFTRDAVKS